MENQFERLELTIGKEKIQKLRDSRAIVFGLGGVGSYVVEALVRSGLGAIDIVDNDTVSVSNINRQLYALHSTVGKNKVDVAEERIRDINPDCAVTKYKIFFLPENSDSFDFTRYDYIIDCIDTVKGKIEIITRAKEAGKPVISAMGAGNKLDPTKFQVADISKTSVCPLARVIRNELKKRRIKNVKCVFSTEITVPPKTSPETNAAPQEKKLPPAEKTQNGKFQKQIPGSNAFVPSVAGLIIASEVIKDLISLG